jgi:RHS repeat-associated protein
MLLTDNHFTPLLGVDIHFTTVPPFNPLHPFIGLIMDPFDYIPYLGTNVHVNGMKRGVSDTSGMLVTFNHIPLVGAFAMMPMIGHESMNFFSSAKTFADGTRLSPKGHMVMSCNDIGIPLNLQLGTPTKPKKKIKIIPSLYAPTTFSLPIPTGMPVNLGGPYVPDWGGMLQGLLFSMGFGVLMKLGKKVLTKFNKVLKKVLGDNNILSKMLCKAGFEPVNLVNGAVWYEGVDFEMNGPMPLVWDRFWSSGNNYVGWMGHGVQNSYDREVEIFPEEDAIGLRLADGRVIAFPLLSENDSFYLRQEKITLYRLENGFEAFDHQTNITYNFEQPFGKNKFKMNRIVNGNGFEINFLFKGKLLSEIIDATGKRYSIVYNQQEFIQSVVFHGMYGDQTMITYEYDKLGNMTAIRDTLDKTTNIWFEKHLMVKKTDRNGQTFYWEYDGKETGARCVHTWGDGGWQEGWIEYFPEEGYNLVTDANGNVTTYYYTPDQLVTQIKDPMGNSTFTEYTEFNEIYREFDALGNMTGYTYDDNGNRTSITYPDGSQSIFAYNEHNQLILAIDPQGNQTVYTYDKENPYLLKYVVEPDNGITSFEYNENNLIKKVAKADNAITLEYTKEHYLEKMTDSRNNVTQWTYTPKGEVERVFLPEDRKQMIQYDKLGRVTNFYDTNDGKTKFEYNAYDEVTKIKDNFREIKFDYTPMGSLASREEKGVKVSFFYDRMEQLLRIANEHNASYKFIRNQAGFITEEIDFDGKAKKLERDAAGRIIKVVKGDNEEQVIDYEHDAFGRIIRANYQDGSWEMFDYNKNGQIVEVRNQNSAVFFQRDNMGRIIAEKITNGLPNDPGYTIISEYDKKGNRIAVKTSLGAEIHNSFDELGFQSLLEAKTEQLLQAQKTPWQAQYKRNAFGQITEANMSGDVNLQNVYDNGGRLAKQTVKGNNKETFNRSYYWNFNNSLRMIIDNITKGETTFTYDAFDNLSAGYFENGTKQFKSPDKAGNVYNSPDQTDRTYGNNGQILKDLDWHYYYDGLGNLIHKTPHAQVNAKKTKWQQGDWWYTWYSNGFLKEVKDPDGKMISFEYDAIGRRLSKTTNGKVKRFLWDGNVLVHEFEYLEKDKPQTIIDELGIVLIDKEEPVENLITWIYEEGSFVPTAKIQGDEKFSIISDYIGRPIQAYNEKGEKIWDAEYDLYGKIRKLESSIGLGLDFIPFRFQGHYKDDETGLCYARFRYYDPSAGQFTSKDPIEIYGSNPTMYGYVYDSNSQIDPFGLDLIPNKAAGMQREELAKEWLQKKYPNAEIYSERYIRDSDGKSVKDINGSRRRVDFVVVEDGKVKGMYEVTSPTAKKTDQMLKEADIRANGGTHIKAPGRKGKLHNISKIKTKRIDVDLETNKIKCK